MWETVEQICRLNWLLEQSTEFSDYQKRKDNTISVLSFLLSIFTAMTACPLALLALRFDHQENRLLQSLCRCCKIQQKSTLLHCWYVSQILGRTASPWRDGVLTDKKWYCFRCHHLSGICVCACEHVCVCVSVFIYTHILVCVCVCCTSCGRCPRQSAGMTGGQADVLSDRPGHQSPWSSLKMTWASTWAS